MNAPLRTAQIHYLRSALTPELRMRIETAIERLISVLDGVELDPDMEPSLVGEGQFQTAGDDRELDESEREPSLGWTEAEACRNRHTWQPEPDLEAEHDGREPSLCGNIGASHAVGPGDHLDREGGDDNGIGDDGGLWEQVGI